MRDYKGEGIQHVALGTNDIYRTVDRMRASGVAFQDTPDTYYEGVDGRVTGHAENLDELQKRRVLIDGAPTEDKDCCYRSSHRTWSDPVSSRSSSARGTIGFGEGNFKALFESLELDQIRTAVILSAAKQPQSKFERE